jgi:uncharacterized damage-inducible protein DinB
MQTTSLLIQLWQEGRTRFTQVLEKFQEEDLKKKLSPAPNSIGFLVRHIGDVELLFAKNVFGQELQVRAKTVVAQRDTGEWTNLGELKDYVAHSAQMLQQAIEAQSDDDWNSSITTKEFGTKTKAEALGRITTHTAYHAGQISMLLKYGQ